MLTDKQTATLLNLQAALRAVHEAVREISHPNDDPNALWQALDFLPSGHVGIVSSIEAIDTMLYSLDYQLIGAERAAGGFSLPSGPVIHDRVRAKRAETAKVDAEPLAVSA